MAQAAGVKKLVLSHMGPHLSSHGPLEQGIADVGKVYDGAVLFAEELMSFEVKAGG
jgi:ribonuclease BN (tRNA processing enzyme)